ncbi:MAG: aspartate aminotransferase family protein, partial [Myxococcota bacterium]
MSLLKVGNHGLALHDAITEPEAPIPDRRHVALFYQSGKQLPTVSHAKGLYLWDTEGNRYLDGCSGAFSANLGHGDEAVIQRAVEQLGKVAFAYRTQFANEPASELANLLAALSPPELNRVFLVNSGSEGVETAIKLARQYWWAIGDRGKHFVIARRPSYHGATLGALSASDYAPLNVPFRPLLLPMHKVAAPYCYHCPLEKEYPGCNIACAHELEKLIHVLDPENIAAFITEPIGGASTGAAVPPDEYFPIIERICHDNNILLIIDDVLTGCGRTGRFYGFQHWDVVPDIVVLSKGLSAGYTPIGAVLASDDIVRPVVDGGGFQHG